ncbi:glycosyltransferase [Streptomyces sp. RFCAC02]|uniref:glycosyltransferase family 2 protein n=1 Tax=Streptomyces sp. RFCAC02 TaxID=2499143 RepID=UPI001021BA9F|nr:glycosyltransferase [Streptomyces sp. RFCAC02]
MRFSVVIPYRQRLANLRLALSSLAEQTLPRDEFEVVVGALDYSPEYTAMCAGFLDRLDIVSVLSPAPWQVGHARNLALRQARGDVIVCLDADMTVPPGFLAGLWERHYAYGQRVCVTGQMLDYDNNGSDVAEVTARPWEHYRAQLAALEARAAAGDGVRDDPRLGTPHVIPWAYAWTALVAVPRALVEEHGLYFDPEFHGYGVEDLEWAYRIAATGTPVVMAPDVYGIHLPHARNVAANKETETRNYRYFVRKWPGPDTELAAAFGDFEANAMAREYRAALAGAAGPGRSLAVVRSGDRLWIGAEADAAGGAVTGGPFPAGAETLPLGGVALPFDDGGMGEVRVLPAVGRLPARYRDAVLAEARRVAASGTVTEGDAA